MKASDIMTCPVITVGPDTPVRYIAGLLFEHRVSAVPVLENGTLVGIVSEADLLHRHEIGTLLEKRGIRRVPVAQDGRIAGIVSRSDLVRALAAKGRLMNAGDSSDGASRVGVEDHRVPLGAMAWSV